MALKAVENCWLEALAPEEGRLPEAWWVDEGSVDVCCIPEKPDDKEAPLSFTMTPLSTVILGGLEEGGGS